MKAVILAAGIASRLRPLTDTTPKCLLKVGERCLLQRAFDALLQNGFREFVIVTGYRQQQIVNFLEAHYPALEVTFIYNPQIQISAESETKRSIFRERDKTKRSKKESAQHSKSRNKSFVMTSVSAL